MASEMKTAARLIAFVSCQKRRKRRILAHIRFSTIMTKKLVFFCHSNAHPSHQREHETDLLMFVLLRREGGKKEERRRMEEEGGEGKGKKKFKP